MSFAGAGGHVDCMKALVKVGCDTCRLTDGGASGWSLAAQSGKSELVKGEPHNWACCFHLLAYRRKSVCENKSALSKGLVASACT